MIVSVRSFRILLLLLSVFPVSVYAEGASFLSDAGFKRLDGLSSSPFPHQGSKGEVKLVQKYDGMYGRVSEFSHDSRLFALLQIYDENLVGIRVWDTQSGELKHRTVIPFFADAAGGSYLNLDFSPDNRMLIITGMVGHPHITWEFTKTDKASQACRGYMSSWVEEISQDSQTYTALTADSEFSLCQPGIKGELLNYKDWLPQTWWGDSLRVLHNNKVLVIHNIRTESIAPHQIKEQPDQAMMEYIDLWDLNYASKAELLIKQIDSKTRRLFLFESFKEHLVINQWDYSSRKQLTKQIFKNIKANKLYFSDQYLLLRADNQFALFERNDEQLSLLWNKNLGEIYQGLGDGKGPYSIHFSADDRQIIFTNTQTYMPADKMISPVVLVATDDGNIKKYPANKNEWSLRVEANAEFFLENRTDWCAEKNTTIYSLKHMQKAGKVEGGVMAMSPDGRVIAICRDRMMSLWRR